MTSRCAGRNSGNCPKFLGRRAQGEVWTEPDGFLTFPILDR